MELGDKAWLECPMPTPDWTCIKTLVRPLGEADVTGAARGVVKNLNAGFGL